jgi:hypothetical protein
MHEVVNSPAVQIFIGTLPILAVLILNLIEVRTVRTKVGELAERVSKIEGKIEGRHVLVE